MHNFSIIILLTILFNSFLINCKLKPKKSKNNPPYKTKKYIPPADLIRPTDVSRELFCDVCQAIFTEALKNLRYLNKESDVTFYLNNNNICAQKNFDNYHFSKPEMEIGCEVFIGEYYDEVQKLLIERNPSKDTNKTLIDKFCYRTIKACNGVNLSKFKPIQAEIINGELYDIEQVERVYKVTPQIEEVNYDEEDTSIENKTSASNKSAEL